MSGSTRLPGVALSQSTNRDLGCPLGRAGTARGTPRRRPAAASSRSCVEIGDPAVADRVGDQLRQRRVGQQQPAPRRDAVGLVVEPLGEHLGEVGEHAACAAGPSGSPRRRWCCACRRSPGSPSAPCAPASSSIRLIRATRSVVAGIARADVVQEAPVDLVDDLEVPRQEQLEELDRPLLQRLGQQRVVGVGQGADGEVPGLVPAELRLVEQDAHQLGHGHRRVGVVELDGDLVGQRRPVVRRRRAEARDDVLQRAARPGSTPAGTAAPGRLGRVVRDRGRA